MEPLAAFLAGSGGDSIALCSSLHTSAQHYIPGHRYDSTWAPLKLPREDSVGRMLTHNMRSTRLSYAAGTLKL